MPNVYIIGNADTAKLPSKIKDDDTIVMFNIPLLKNIQPDVVFVANTFPPARRFVKSKCYDSWDRTTTKFIFPYTDEIIKSSPIHQCNISFKRKIRGWRNNSYKKCRNGFQYIFLPETTYKEALKYLNLNPKNHVPSTGFLAICYYLATNYNIFISGFSFEGFEGHNWKSEKKFVYDLISNGEIATL